MALAEQGLPSALGSCPALHFQEAAAREGCCLAGPRPPHRQAGAQPAAPPSAGTPARGGHPHQHTGPHLPGSPATQPPVSPPPRPPGRPGATPSPAHAFHRRQDNSLEGTLVQPGAQSLPSGRAAPREQGGPPAGTPTAWAPLPHSHPPAKGGTSCWEMARPTPTRGGRGLETVPGGEGRGRPEAGSAWSPFQSPFLDEMPAEGAGNRLTLALPPREDGADPSLGAPAPSGSGARLPQAREVRKDARRDLGSQEAEASVGPSISGSRQRGV